MVDRACVISVPMTQVVDEARFAELTQRYRGELQVHCYRMLASFDESEDMVQETFLRAWRRREAFEGRAGGRGRLPARRSSSCSSPRSSICRRGSAPR